VAINGAAFSWNFLLADVQFPIIGIDFLRHFNLVVDVSSQQLLPSPGVTGGGALRNHYASYSERSRRPVVVFASRVPGRCPAVFGSCRA
jgi:hypothetical protein